MNIWFSPQKRLIKIENALCIGGLWLLLTGLGLIWPASTPLTLFGGALASQNIFFSWWYLALELLLTASLISCSLLDQLFVVKCVTNTTTKLNTATVSTGPELNLCTVRFPSMTTSTNQIIGNDRRFLQQKLFRHWAPLGVHGVVSALTIYGALNMLYCFKTFQRVSVGDGFFLSGPGLDETSAVYMRPIAYARINDLWTLEQTSQPFVDVSFLTMNGEEYDRFTLTTSSNSTVTLKAPGDLSVQSLTPRRIRLKTEASGWQLPALAIKSNGTTSPSWLSYGWNKEIVLGRESVFLKIATDPSKQQEVLWVQQDLSENISDEAGTPFLVEVLKEGSLSWATNDLSSEILFLPLLTVLALLFGSPRDVVIGSD